METKFLGAYNKMYEMELDDLDFLLKEIKNEDYKTFYITLDNEGWLIIYSGDKPTDEQTAYWLMNG